ncbi:hypothetical protein CAEBREN_05969 [Caenorhabditis brenneri]|uniref:Uncharacterized protein n=1 Tax=Caenorhabditis brenneri TaxID=135651 RepID=G0N9J4_CAEBE|nr:hypothetical protein CAEBREN_05969 [Caenorhabditis brenneri]
MGKEKNNELKKLTEGTTGDNDPCAARLAIQSRAHTEEVAKLNNQIETLKKDLENLNMKALRVSVLEKTLKKTTDQMNELKQQNEKLSESNRQLTQQQSVSATDVESKTATTSTQRPTPPIRQTPTKVSAPVPSVPKQPTEPDQSSSQIAAPRRFSFGRQVESSNIVPPAPAPSNASQPNISPTKRPVPPSIPNEPMDIIPPVPSDNIPVVPDPTPPTNTFGSSLPVPLTFQSSARVPAQSLFSSSSTTTVQPQKNVLPSIDSAPSTPGSSLVTTTSSLVPGQNLFGNTGAPSITTSSLNPTLPEESVAEGAAGQSSLVSGSIDQQKTLEMDNSANDGESRDSSNAGGVSSSDVRRKRTATDFQLNEAKRQRDSPNEAVTSTETRQPINVAEIPELDDDEVVLGMEHDISDEDPNDNTLQERRQDIIDLENDEEVLEDEMEGDEDDDDSLGNDEEYEDETGAPEEDEDDDIVVLSDDDAPENDDDAESLNDVDDDDIEEIQIVQVGQNDDMEEVLGGEDSQPSLDDQDREAASAVEEAEDEGRDPLGLIDEPSAPADPTGASGVGSSGRMGQEAQRVRLPTGLREAEREDQCSSSNETNEERPIVRNIGRGQMRGAKPTRGVYTPGRGNRGGRGGAA